jgi:N-methylhydantoinase B/oxoprolinase/acetone carboxylase alpha subunit
MLAYQDLMDYSERLMRKAIRALPDGDYAAETTIDGFLDDEEAKRRDLKIKATLKVRGDEMTVDLTGTAPQVDDRPINMPLEGTVDCAIWLTLRSILLDSAVYGNVAQNMGLTRPTHIVAPKGTLANPNFPARVIARFCPGNALADTVMKALAQCVPGQVSAGIGNLRCVAFTGLHEGRHWVQMETLKGSYGGRKRPRRDGRRRHALRQHAKQSDRGHRVASAASRQSIDAVVSGIMDGSLKVPLEETFPFGEAPEMLGCLASRQVAGKLILAVNPD